MSSDADQLNGYDSLSYEWSFDDGAQATVVNTQDKNAKVKVQFDAVGTHTIKLTVTDDYGKIAEIEKEIQVDSTLRPEIFALPVATSWGNPINFVVKSNQPLVNYEWDFLDGDKRIIQEDKITHIYKKAGVYAVTLKVSGAEGMTNQITKTIFIGEKSYPIGGYTIVDPQGNVQTQNTTCS